MKIKILKPVIVVGVAKKEDDIVDVNKNIRNLLVKMDKAEDVSDEDAEALEKEAAAKAEADAKEKEAGAKAAEKAKNAKK